MKTFNKVISLVTAIVFVFSLMIVPAFAAGLEDYPDADGAEKLTVTYYSDEALANAITTAAPGDTVYAKVTANLPTETLRSLNVDLAVANATIESEKSLLSLTGFERTTVAGTTLNTVFTSKTGANIYVALADGSNYDSPTNKEDWNGKYEYTNIGVKSFDITSYKLTVGASGTVSFSNAGGVGLYIGVVNKNDKVITSPFTIEGELAIGGSTPTAKEATFVATFDETKEYDHKLSDADLKDAISKDITVKKTVGGVDTPVNVADLDINYNTVAKTFTIDFTNGLASGETFAAGAEKTKTFSYRLTTAVTTYTFKAIEFNGTEVSGTFNADYATYYAGDALKNAIKVKAEKFVDGASQGVVDALNDDYEVIVANSTATNTANVTVNFKGNLATTGTKALAVTYDNVPVDYSNVKAELTTTEFANNTDAAAVKAAVKVTATKTQGVIVTDNVVMTLDSDYTVAIDGDPATVTASGFVTVTLIGDLTGKTLDPADGKLNFTVTPDMIEYENYSVEFEGGVTKFLATATDEEIKAKITVKADKKVNGAVTVVGEVVAPANYDVTIDRSTGTVEFTLKAGTLYAGGTIPSQTITFEDVYNYNIGEVTMSPKMFDAAVTDDTIKAAVTVKGEVWKNGTKDSDKTYVLDTDYNVVVDRTSSKVTVKFIGDLAGNADRTFAIAIGVNAQAKITLGAATVNVGDDLKATVNIEGLAATDKIYGAVVEFNITTGAIKNVNIAAGYNKVDSASDIKMKEATITLARDMSGTATNKLFEFAIDTTGLAKDDVITVTVTSLKLTTVEGDDVATLPSFTGDSASATVTEVVVPTTAKISAEFNIKTLGDVTSAADKFKSGLTVTKDGAAVAAASNISVADKKIKLTDLEVEAGTYKVTVNVPGYTKAEVEIVVAYDASTNMMKVTGGTTGDNAIYAGDIDSNGKIDAKDYADLVAAYGKDVASNVKCDLYTADGETVINLNDIITMVYEFETYFGSTISTTGIIE